jgi:hypothetical protein
MCTLKRQRTLPIKIISIAEDKWHKKKEILLELRINIIETFRNLAVLSKSM